MATTYKTLLNNDIATTRTLLHESIPVTGTIVSGTYTDKAGAEYNIKTYAHGMFQSVYDYPYLSSSANHIFDITMGISANSEFTGGADPGSGPGFVSSQFTKKRNIYDQMAQVLVPYSSSGVIQNFDQDGDLTGGRKMNDVFFLNFSRLLTKDEIKKGTFSITFMTGGAVTAATDALTISDYGATGSFKVNSPTGEYGLLYTGSADAGTTTKACGHIYYQAGIAVITSSIFSIGFLTPTDMCDFGAPDADYDIQNYQAVITGSTIDSFAEGVRNRIKTLSFNNTTELNSTIYFCRANTGDYNYSSNPTYLSASKIRVKGDNPFAEPVSYLTTVGLYSPNNELLAVAKLSEPLKKTPSNEVTLRVRLDY
tara:strand:- start:4008 stop:5111 length:1104 start_codon:yes stop_codon:yes gene_type:complete